MDRWRISDVSPGFQGTLGCGFMTGLGVKMAHPDRPVVSITGDGGSMFGVQEPATAVQHGIGPVTVPFNDGAHGDVPRDQRTGFDGRLIGSELHTPDFQHLAASFGVGARRVGSPRELGPVLEEAIRSGEPAPIEAAMDRAAETSSWGFIHPKR